MVSTGSADSVISHTDFGYMPNLRNLQIYPVHRQGGKKMARVQVSSRLDEKEAHDYFAALEERVGVSMRELAITVKHAHFDDVGSVGDWRYYIYRDEWAKMSVGARIDAFLVAKAKADAEE